MIHVYCGNNHQELEELKIEEGMYQLFYACPKYQMENRNPNEKACNNRISVDDYENMITHVSSMIEEAEMNNTMLDLTNVKWVKKNIEFTIFEHTKDSIKIFMKNKVAINK